MYLDKESNTCFIMHTQLECLTNIAIVILILISGTVQGQYVWSYEDDVFRLELPTNIESFGDDFLVNTSMYYLNPLRYREEAGILSTEDYFVEYLGDFVDQELDGFRRTSQLVISPSAAVVSTFGDLSTDGDGLLFTIIDSLGIVTASLDMGVDFLLEAGLLPDSDSTFIYAYVSSEMRDSVVFRRMNLDLETLEVASFSRGSTNINVNAIKRSAEGNYLMCIDHLTESGLTIEVVEVSATGEEIYQIDVPYPWNYEGYTDIDYYGEEGFALVDGYRNESDLGCIVGGCPQSGDVAGTLSIFPDRTSSREYYELKFYPFGLTKDTDGEVIVYGTTLDLEEDQRAVLFKPAGWANGGRLLELEPNVFGELATNGGTSLRRLRLTSDGTFIGAGQHIIFGGERYLNWFFELDVNECLSNDCNLIVASDDALVSNENTKLSSWNVKVQPNPFLSSVSISSDLTSFSLKVNLRDVNGATLVKQLINGSTTINTDHLPEGIYFLTIDDGSKQETVKVVKR